MMKGWKQVLNLVMCRLVLSIHVGIACRWQLRDADDARRTFVKIIMGLRLGFKDNRKSRLRLSQKEQQLSLGKYASNVQVRPKELRQKINT